LTVRELLFGRRLANRENQERKIGAFEAIPAMGLDGVGSSAYGPEAALAILIPLGTASIHYIGWVMLPIVLLLGILCASYWQTIRAYPTNGGAYIVARENLGRMPSLIAAAGLMIDYVLNVAVGISAGVAALVSAVPQLHQHMLALCLGILAFVTIVNLRGTLDAGRAFAIPTYTFIGCFLAVLVVGAYRTIVSGGHPHAVVSPPRLPAPVEVATWWLLLRAFAAGCTAMTGVEAVSNAMTAFRDPPVKLGHRTLLGICLILGTLLVGIASLTTAYEIGAMDQSQPTYRSVLSQLTSAVVGNGAMYYVTIGALLCVLVLSSSTSFVDFPRLCRAVAQDGYLPKTFTVAGRRLVFSVGIIYLAVTAGILLIVFGGITDHLIPLFAVGAFTTFTISQIGMVVHWRRALGQRQGESRRAVRMHLATNAVGAATTGTALLIIVVAKFFEGAWITIAILPPVIVMLQFIRRYYDELGARVRKGSPLDLAGSAAPLAVVTFDEWNQVADKTLRFAFNVSPDVVGVHLTALAGPDSAEEHRKLQQQWQRDVAEPTQRRGLNPPRLIVVQAQYRTIEEPVLNVVQQLKEQFPDRSIAVLIPELIKQRWYQHLLHTHRGRRLRSRLLRRGAPRLTVISVPWYLEPESPASSDALVAGPSSHGHSMWPAAPGRDSPKVRSRVPAPGSGVFRSGAALLRPTSAARRSRRTACRRCRW
jgi:amino acid transporter